MMNLTRKSFKSLTYIFFIIIFVYPLFFVVFSAFKTPQTFATNFWLPSIKGFTLSNLRAVWFDYKFSLFFSNSLIVSAVTAVVIVVFSSTAGYAFARLKFPLKEPVFFLILAMMFLPVFIYLVPLFIRMSGWSLTNTLSSLILVYTFICLPQAIYISRSYYESLPGELKEAGMIDGAGELRVFINIYLPLSMPAVSCIVILTFIRCWGEYIWATLSSKSDTVKTIPVGLGYFTNAANVYWWYQMAALAIVIVPTVLVFIVFSKAIMGGLTEGAVKG